MPPSLPRRSVETQYPHPLFIFVFESQADGGNGKKKGWGGPQCVPPILFAPARHEPVFTILVESKCCVGFFVSLGQSGSRLCHVGRVKMLYVFFFVTSPASKITSVPCRLRQSVVSVFPTPWASKIASVSCRFLPSCLLHASHRKNVDPSRKHEPVCAMSVESKCCVCSF